jgi:hypothetical protein
MCLIKSTHFSPGPHIVPQQDLSPWLMLVILATQEAEIRRIKIRSQPGQIVCKTLAQKYLSKRKKERKKEKGLVEWLKIGPEFKPPILQKKKKTKI